MPSLKTERAAKKKRLRNQPVRSALKTLIGKVEGLISEGEREVAKKAAQAAIKALDKAAEKGIIHPNNAARRKSRLMGKLNKALSAPAPQPTKPRKRKVGKVDKNSKE